MQTTLILADAAEIDQARGTAHALGMGWNITSTPAPPMSLLFLLDVDWDHTNEPFNIDVNLHDQDGHSVLVQAPGGGPVPLQIHAEAEVGRPAGTPPGTKICMPFSVSIAPGLPLASGQSYTWEAIITRKTPDGNGEELSKVSQGFYVR